MRLKRELLAVVWTIFINGGVQRGAAATGAAEADRARRKLEAMQAAAKLKRLLQSL
jgi:hypothetical protein